MPLLMAFIVCGLVGCASASEPSSHDRAVDLSVWWASRK